MGVDRLALYTSRLGMRALQISKYNCQQINGITEDCVAQEPGKWVDFNCTTYIQIGKLPKATKSRPPL